MIAPPTNSASANCQPSSSHSRMPSSTTRLVLATMKTIAAVKSAPAGEQALGQRGRRVGARGADHPEERRPGERRRPVVAQRAPHLGAGDERLHRTGEREPEHQRPERLPEHEERLVEPVPGPPRNSTGHLQ